MTTTRPTLTQFLLARIGEDESARRTAVWATFKDDRAKREIQAKRDIVGSHPVQPYRRQSGCPTCNLADDGFSTEGPCDTLRILGAIYADHPDYLRAWKPWMRVADGSMS